MQKAIKQTLLRLGGYAVARRLYAYVEHRRLAQRYRKLLQRGEAPLPDMVMFEPTQRCNLSCKMCYQDRGSLANRGELTLQQITGFFDQNPYLQKVTLMGGEIFMRQDMMALIRYLDQTRDIVLSTNGTLLGHGEITALAQCQHIVTISISLDGPKPVHEAIRRVGGSYDKTVQAITGLAAVIPVTVTCVIQNDNIEVLPELVDLCAAMGVKKLKFEFERLYPQEQITAQMGEGRQELLASNGSKRGYSLQTLQAKLSECQDRGRKNGVYVAFDPPYLINKLAHCYSGNLRSQYRYICQSLRMATIAPNGDVINCYAIRQPFGNILDRPFNEIWNGEIARGYRGQLLENNLRPLCENCPFMYAYSGE